MNFKDKELDGLPQIKGNLRVGKPLKNRHFKHTRILGIMLIALCILAIGSVSFAYFATSTQKKELESTITTAKVSVRFADNDNGVSGELKFRESITKKFLIENTGTAEARVNMFWDGLVNSFISGSLTYTLSYITEDGSAVPVIRDALVPRSKEPSRQNLAEDLIIPVGATVEYELTVTLNRLEDVNQESDLNAVFYSNFWAEDSRNKIPENMIMAVGWNFSDKMWAHKEDIKRVVFETTMKPKKNAVYTYDISSAQDKTVMSYLVSDGNGGYIAYIQTEGEAIANPNSGYLFCNFYNLEAIEGLDYLNTKGVNAMNDMFHSCEKLTSLDLSNFDTNNVTNMGHMFFDCSSLADLNINNFDTKNVQYMDNMFNGCSSLNVLDLSSFNTNNVISMGYMFAMCEQLKNLDLSNFNTSNVTDMAGMFALCYNLGELDISSFDTKNVTTMHRMFNQCTSLEVIDMTNFDLSSVTDISRMFSMWWNDNSIESNLQIIKFPNKSMTPKLTNMYDMFGMCNKLKYVDLSGFDTRNVTDMYHMFYECNDLTSITFGDNFDTSNVTNMESLFMKCRSLVNLDLSNFDTSNVTDMSRMFYECNNLISITFGNGFDTSNVTNMSQMFNWCTNLASIDVSHFDTSNVTNMSQMFDWCTNLASIDVSHFETSKVTSMESMFGQCRKLTELNINNFDTSQVTSMKWMFSGCVSLTTLDLSNFNTENVTNMNEMFSMAHSGVSPLENKLEEIKGLENFKTNKVTDMAQMFYNCNKLKELNLTNFDVNSIVEKTEMLAYVSNTIKIFVSKDAMKQWVLDNSSLTESNIVVV